MLLTAAAALAALPAGCGGLAEGEVARVYGQSISQDAWNQRVDLLAMSGGAPPDAMSPESRDRVYRQAARQLVMEKIIARQGEERGLTASDQDVQAQLDKLIELRYAGDRDALRTDLEARNSTEAEMFEGIRVQLTQQKLYDDVAAGVEATDEETYDAFQRFTETYQSPEYRKFRMLVVADAATAQDLRRRIDAGEDFATLAVQYTTDEQSKGTQGEESLQKGQASERIPPEVIAAVFGMPVFQMAGPIETGRGFYIVQLSYVEPGKETPFDHAKEQFRKQARAQKVQIAWQEFLDQAEKDAGALYREDVDPAKANET